MIGVLATLGQPLPVDPASGQKISVTPTRQATPPTTKRRPSGVRHNSQLPMPLISGEVSWLTETCAKFSSRAGAATACSCAEWR